MPDQSTHDENTRQYTKEEIEEYTHCLRPLDPEGNWDEWVRYRLAALTVEQGIGSTFSRETFNRRKEIVRSSVEEGRKIWESRQKAVSNRASNAGNTAVPPTVPEDDKTAQPPSNTRQPSQQTDASQK